MKKYLNIKIIILITVIGIILFFFWNRSPSIEWENEISWETLNEAIDIKQTDDGGYIILGTSVVGLTLVKVDAIGNTVWVKTILERSQKAGKVIELSNDGGYIIGGYSYSFIGQGHFSERKLNENFWVSKLDKEANVIWSKEYDDGANREEIVAIECTEDGNYVLAGHKEHYRPDSINSSDYWISKLDNEGTLIWSKVLGGSDKDTPMMMRKTEKVSYVIEGRTYSKDGDVPEKNTGNLPYSIWSIEVNDTGEIINSQRKSAFHVGRKTTLTDDGEYLIAGQKWVGDAINGSVDLFLEKRDINFNLKWSKTITAPGKDESITIHQTNDGGYIILATQYYENQTRQKLIKLGY